MANLTESTTYTAGVYQLETTDPVLGGAGGIANSQAQALANRTKYLKAKADLFEPAIDQCEADIIANYNEFGLAMAAIYLNTGGIALAAQQDASGKFATTDFVKKNGGRYASILNFTNTTSLSASQLFSLITFSGANNFLTTLPAIAGASAGVPIHFKHKGTGSVGLKGSGSETLNNGIASRNIFYMHAGEEIELVSDGTEWLIAKSKSNIETVGEIVTHFVAMPGTLICDGSTFSRAAYPRLWEWVAANAASINDGSWTGNKGLFSNGDGSTTFKVPDLRGQFIRGLDVAGAVEPDGVRVLGTEQAEGLKSHDHAYNDDTNTYNAGHQVQTGSTDVYDTQATNPKTTSAFGGSETRPMNVAYNFCVKF